MSFLPAEREGTAIEEAKVAISGPSADRLAAASVLRMQATIGNRATTRLLGRAARPVQQPPRRQLQRGVFSALGLAGRCITTSQTLILASRSLRN